MELHNLIRYTFLACSIGTLAACSSANNGTPAPTTTTISGSVFAAPVNGADVYVKDTNGNTITGPVTTGADGSFTVTLENTDLASDLVFESTGGVFTDEATGDPNISAGPMVVMIEANSLGSTSNSVHATPESTIVHELVTQYGMTMAEAKDAFTSAFSYTPDHTIAPTDATNPAAGADESELLAGLRAAAFSQLAADMMLTPGDQFELFIALARDLSDGTLDGKVGMASVIIQGTATSLPEDIQYRFAAALLNFRASGNDNTGLNDAQIGILPFAKVVLTNSYRIEYSSMMEPMQGKSVFNLKITNLSDGSDALMLTPSLTPLMNMSDRQHSAPFVDFVDNGNGIYSATVYYLMPSVMMTGETMGYWDLGVEVDTNETAHYYPGVMMAMADNTTRVQLKGVNDMIIDMSGLEVPRPYNLFRDDLTTAGGGSYQFDIFIAPMETMMSFPALLDPMTLMSGMGGTPYDVNVVEVDVSVNNGNWMTNKDTDNGDGTWSLNGLSLDSGANEIRVRLTVSGETKTTNGLVAEPDVNDFATFTVTLP